MSHHPLPPEVVEGLADGPIKAAVTISRGSPCRCGPGFCANRAGVGFFGTCAGSRETSAPACGRCGAPHQSDAGCWLCSTTGPRTEDDAATSAMWLRALRLGAHARDLFRRQDEHLAAGRFVTLDAVLDEIEALDDGQEVTK